MGKRLRLKRSAAVGKGNREMQSVATSMPELPECAIDDILSRLPVKDLLCFRCVSKRWCALIDSPVFIKLQLNQSLETRTNLSLMIFRDYKLYSADLDMLDGVLELGGSVPRLDVVEVDNPVKCEDYYTSVEGSCNGLICLHRFKDEAIALLNPSTKEYRILPPVPPEHGGYPTFYGMVYDPVSDECKVVTIFYGIVYDPVGDDYKVVRIVQFFDDSHSLFSHVMVYGLRSNIWQQICVSFTYYLYLDWKKSSINPGVLVNSALHWLACRDRVDLFDIVVAVDPVDDKHWEVQVPQVSSCSYGTLGVLGGCLCLFYAINEEDPVEFTAELWVMNDYMVDESWTKLFRVTLPNIKSIKVHTLECPRVLAYSKSSREVILLQMFGNLIWYDLKEKRFVDLGICSFAAVVNVKSLVRLSYDQ